MKVLTLRPDEPDRRSFEWPSNYKTETGAAHSGSKGPCSTESSAP